MPPELLNLHRELVTLQGRFEWLPEWAAITLVILAFAAAGWLANQTIFSLLKWAVRKRDVFWRGLVGRARTKVRLVVLILAVGIGV
ncbi:hypothetical protein, partial [Klebsiella pneumoniae]|uniref:hypothetical protein n=1 Tax=Klebsiella pneumoniae TaxID=573 RepID=UPI0022B9DA72